MTPDQVTLAKNALGQMKTISVQASLPHNADSLSDLLAQNDILDASISLADLTATGFSRAGLAALDALARSFRPQASQNSCREDDRRADDRAVEGSHSGFADGCRS